uniref:WW domain binding protein VOPP1 n=1 Tax=Suricata suricatta TaxID=37032 RepID=A0A673TK93_SURSU
MSRQPRRAAALLLGLLVECTEAKKHCWYFEGLYPTYYICRPYEDCCGSRCCVRALSIQRLWYFWFLLMMGVLFCCGAGFFIRRRMYPPPLIEEPAFNVSYTRQPPNTTPGAGQNLRTWGKKLKLSRVNACGTDGRTDLVSLCEHMDDARGTVTPVDQAVSLIAQRGRVIPRSESFVAHIINTGFHHFCQGFLVDFCCWL